MGEESNSLWVTFLPSLPPIILHFPPWIENQEEKNQSLEYGVREGYVGLPSIIIDI